MKRKTSKTPRERVAERAIKYAENFLTQINTDGGEFMGNQKCYQNTRQRMEWPWDRAAMCIVFLPDGRGANLHFVNKTLFGLYRDNTLGFQSEVSYYFLIKEFTKKELDTYSKWKIYPQIVDDYQDKFLNMWFTKQELKKYGIGREHF